jgi:molybdopterin-guanine dinucleotide biosynthesis protein A
MGTDKAWLEINGRPMIEWVLAAAQAITGHFSIIISPDNANAERYAELAAEHDARLLFDLHDHQGPLGGIHTALANCDEGDAALNLACDLPFLTAEFLVLLCQKHESSAANITVPLDAEGRLQPLAAIYDQSCQAAAEELLAARRLRVDQLFDVVPTQRIAFPDFAHLPGALQFFVNLNSPEDLSFVVKP